MLNDRVILRVLIVDDERIIADTLALILSQRGFAATAVYSGEKAVETASVLRPDILITDVVMEGMTGIEAAIRISETVPSCRILLFSGNAATEDLVYDAEAEGHSFEMLAKPIHPQVLIDHLRACAGRGSKLNKADSHTVQLSMMADLSGISPHRRCNLL